MKDRKVGKQSYVKSTHYGFSELTQCAHALESQLEVDYFNLLNFERSAIGFNAQPFSIYYTINGKERRYTPDFEVEMVEAVYVDEIKYVEDTLEPAFIDKVYVLTEYFKKKNKTFRVITETDIRLGERAENLRYLQRAVQQVPPTQEILGFLDSLSYQECTVSEFQQALQQAGQDPNLCGRAVAHKLINADLTQKWTDIVLSW
ncbi:TnsA endonuclease N-terminal domain-containing protein [Amphritea sp.]|uniref:TnsA endonuclease N-terminal domain-containing protein n=1 Tax=Amphritea sp. TaxID=1872502 RepID=UPI003A91327C